jgi:hypothetical protein
VPTPTAKQQQTPDGASDLKVADPIDWKIF